MNKIIPLVFLVPSLASAAHLCDVGLDDHQMEVVYKAHALGYDSGWGYALAAIAWQESSAGRVVVNMQEHSYGPFQIYMKTAIQREGGKLSPYQQNILASKLLDISFSSKYAMMELEYWDKVHKGVKSKVFASYNGGWRWQASSPQNYSKAIRDKMERLKPCFSGF